MPDFSHTYEVVIFSIGDTKAGTKMGKLQLKDMTDESVLNCVLWEETLNRIDQKIFRAGNQLKILSGSYNEKYNNCLVSNLELVKEASIGLSPEMQEKLFEKIFEYAQKITDEKLKDFIINLLTENKEKFITAPAARLMHHNYLGGLIEHTYECLEIAKSLLQVLYKKIDTNIVYAACILHDFGKIYEYKIDRETGLIDYEEDFQKEWITHSQWGFSMCMTHGFKTVAKMIAAHHGRTEWGAIVDLGEKDLEPIVYLIHHIDDLSAKFGKTTVSDLG